MSKTALRKQILAQRNLLDTAQLQQTSRLIYPQLNQHPSYQQATTILAYMNFGSEFVSDSWLLQVLADGKKLLLPKVNSTTKQLDLYYVDDLKTQLQLGLWNIREPNIERCNPLKALNEVELVLLPGVAFTRDGARLGYGGGFYDKLLARMTHQPVLIAAAFALQLVEQLPQEPTDIKVEWIITEHETIHCSASEFVLNREN